VRSEGNLSYLLRSATDMTTTMPPQLVLPACDHQPRPYQGPSREEVLAMRRQYCNPAVFMLYQEPLMIVEGHKQFVFDETGRRYLDFFAGIVTLSCGHSHPKVVSRVRDQLETLQHTTTIYLHPNFPKFAKALAAKMPPGLDVTYFVNSGSEANELAITMARAFTRNTDIIALRNGYHGGTSGAMALTSHHTWKYNIESVPRIHHVVNPDPYRSPYQGTPQEIASRSAADIRELIKYSTPGQVAGFIAEPINGVGGVTHGALNYLGEAYAIVREHGGLCIADEVQTGFGRTGDHYWGFQNYGVVPDIVTMAKSIGNGLPCAAVTTRADIAKSLATRLHLNTFGGNPLSMAAGLAVLEVIEEEGLQANAKVMGARLKRGLTELMSRHRLVGDVRGMGLMLGVELVEDRATRVPAKSATAAVLEATKEMGLLVGKGGLDGNVLRIKPPLCITAEDVAYALEVLDRALSLAERK
jgi:alanine-glyoxylate transaminase/(R)-3-amino-2-methylpropionate-pyruvate transaminase